MDPPEQRRLDQPSVVPTVHKAEGGPTAEIDLLTVSYLITFVPRKTRLKKPTSAEGSERVC